MGKNYGKWWGKKSGKWCEKLSVNYGVLWPNKVNYGSCSSRNRLDQLRLCANRNRTEERTIDHPRDDRVQASAPRRFPVSTCFDWVRTPPRFVGHWWNLGHYGHWCLSLESHIIYESTPWSLPHSGSCRSPAACPAAPLDTTTRSSFRTTRRDATHEANNSCGARRGVADKSL